MHRKNCGHSWVVFFLQTWFQQKDTFLLFHKVLQQKFCCWWGFFCNRFWCGAYFSRSHCFIVRHHNFLITLICFTHSFSVNSINICLNFYGVLFWSFYNGGFCGLQIHVKPKKHWFIPNKCYLLFIFSRKYLSSTPTTHRSNASFSEQ